MSRPGSAARGYDARWNRFRLRVLRAYPICAVEGCDRPARDVDHIDGLGPLGPRGYDWDNLQALCASCHSRKTVKQDGGFGRREPRKRPREAHPGFTTTP